MPLLVTSSELIRLLAKCIPAASSIPSSLMATKPMMSPIRTYCGMAVQKPKVSISGLAECISPKSSEVASRAAQRYRNSKAEPCMRYPRNTTSSKPVWNGKSTNPTSKSGKNFDGSKFSTTSASVRTCWTVTRVTRMPHTKNPNPKRRTSQRFLPVV